MIISASQIAMQSSQNISGQISNSALLRVFTGSPDAQSQVPNNTSDVSSNVQISHAAQDALNAFNMANIHSAAILNPPSNSTPENNNNNAQSNLDPRMQLLVTILEDVFGQRVRLINPVDFSTVNPSQTTEPITSPTQGIGSIYTQQTTVSQTTVTNFSAQGEVETSDHKEIKFNLSFNTQSTQQETSNITVKSGTALEDPLVINFSANSVQLSAQSFSFDLNHNGNNVSMPFIQGGGYLALNPDSSGKISNKTQLFGPATGNGFAQLQALASQSGSNTDWIDQSNPAYSQLGVLLVGNDGKPQFVSLQQAGIGALNVGSASTQTSIGNSSGATGLLESSGVYLNNDGTVGSMQDVEVNVAPALSTVNV